MSSTLVLVDCGNDSTKLAVCQSISETISIHQKYDSHRRFGSPEELQERDLPGQAIWVISSVNQQRLSELRDWLERKRPTSPIHVVTQRTIPIKVNVDQPERVGIDRLLVAWRSHQLANRSRTTATRGAIVIDAGTAVTVDWIDSQGVFQGGVIFPGIKTCYTALKLVTDKLPQLDCYEIPHQVVGKNTEHAMSSGVLNMQLAAICHFVSSIKTQTSDKPQVFTTGGGINPFLPRLPRSWRYESNLLLDALYDWSIVNLAEFNQS